MASVGLLGFIKGVSGTLEKEYERQNEEAADIRKEGRSEERAKRAEERRIIAERQAAEYQKKLNLKYKPQELDVVAEHERGLIEEGTDPALLRDIAKNEAELARINAGKDPASARKEYDDLSEAGRIRAGMDAETARVNAGTDAAKTKANRTATLEAEREEDRLRAEQGLPPRSSRSKVDLSFSPSEVTSQLASDLTALHEVDLTSVRRRIGEPGGNRLQELRDGGVELSVVLSDPQSRRELKEEVVLKLHNTTSKQLKEKANAKEITSLDDVTALSNVIVERADQTIAALEAAQKMIGSGQDAVEVTGQLRGSLAKAYGEPEEESKQTPAFRSMWNAFKTSLTASK